MGCINKTLRSDGVNWVILSIVECNNKNNSCLMAFNKKLNRCLWCPNIILLYVCNSMCKLQTMLDQYGRNMSPSSTNNWLFGGQIVMSYIQVSSFINTLSTYTCDMRYKTRKITKYKGWVVWNSTSSNIIICQLAKKKKKKI